MKSEYEYEQASSEEFHSFLETYPRPLSRGVTTVCDPPIVNYFDDSLPTRGKLGTYEYFADKQIAKVIMDWVGPDGEVCKHCDRRFWRYYIRKDIQRESQGATKGEM